MLAEELTMLHDQAAPPVLTPMPYADGSIGERKAKAYRRSQVRVRVLVLLTELAILAVFLAVRWLVTRR
jgi:hypothetical protein